MLHDWWQRQLSSIRAVVFRFFEEMTRCRHQKHHRRWPGNPNGRSKFRNLSLFTFTRSQPPLRRWLRGFRRSLKRHVVDVKNVVDGDQDRSKFRNYENLCLQDQAKPLEKHLFSARTPPWFHCTLFFSYYHSQRLLFSPTKNRKPSPETEICILKVFL